MLSSDPQKPDLEPVCKPEKILEGAMQVFLQHGYKGTSMDRVAAQAGVSKHTIYNHFQGKDGLFVALIERLVIRHFQMEFGCELPIADPPEAVLRRMAEILLGRMDDPEYIAFIRLMIAESGRFPDLAQLYMREVICKGDEVLTTYFKAHPELELPDPLIAAQIFCGSLVSHILRQEVLHGKELVSIARGRLVDGLIQILLTGRDRSPIAKE